jgi:hypothetical protein
MEKARAKSHQSVKEPLCPYIEPQVRVEVRDGNTEPQVKYIPQDNKRLNKHRQLKQASLEKRLAKQVRNNQ